MGTGDRDRWERQPGEGERAFAAFAGYRDEPTGGRSIRRVARSLGKSETLIARWSRRWDWQARCAAFDDEQDGLRRLALTGQRLEAAERQARVARAIQDRLLAALESQASSLTDGQVLRMWPAAVEVERRALGLDKADQASEASASLLDDAWAAPTDPLSRLLDEHPESIGEVTAALRAALEAARPIAERYERQD
jgi:hypothetical protein